MDLCVYLINEWKENSGFFSLQNLSIRMIFIHCIMSISHLVLFVSLVQVFADHKGYIVNLAMPRILNGQVSVWLNFFSCSCHNNGFRFPIDVLMCLDHFGFNGGWGEVLESLTTHSSEVYACTSDESHDSISSSWTHSSHCNVLFLSFTCIKVNIYYYSRSLILLFDKWLPRSKN